MEILMQTLVVEHGYRSDGLDYVLRRIVKLRAEKIIKLRKLNGLLWLTCVSLKHKDWWQNADSGGIVVGFIK